MRVMKLDNMKRHSADLTSYCFILPVSSEKTKYEAGVLCGCVTATRKDLPISQRQFYIEGSGQLCEKCRTSVYIRK